MHSLLMALLALYKVSATVTKLQVSHDAKHRHWRKLQKFGVHYRAHNIMKTVKIRNSNLERYHADKLISLLLRIWPGQTWLHFFMVGLKMFDVGICYLASLTTEDGVALLLINTLNWHVWIFEMLQEVKLESMAA